MALKHWSHSRNSFYKYMSAGTAKTVLGNNTLRWSSPALFNDPFDVQFDLHIEYDHERAVERALQTIVDGYLGRAPIVALNPLGQMLTLLRDRASGISEDNLRDTFR